MRSKQSTAAMRPIAADCKTMRIMKKSFLAASMTAVALVLSACSQESASKPYTGRFKVDAGTEYVALDTPSSIGGACAGWSAVSIRKPGNSAGGLDNVICWKRDGDTIIITSKDGSRQTPAPAAAWSD